LILPAAWIFFSSFILTVSMIPWILLRYSKDDIAVLHQLFQFHPIRSQASLAAPNSAAAFLSPRLNPNRTIPPSPSSHLASTRTSLSATLTSTGRTTLSQSASPAKSTTVRRALQSYRSSSGSQFVHSIRVRTVLKPRLLICSKSFFHRRGDSGVTFSRLLGRGFPPANQ